MIHIPLFNVHMSDGVLQWTSMLIDVATFEIPGVNMVAFFGKQSLTGIDQVFKGK